MDIFWSNIVPVLLCTLLPLCSSEETPLLGYRCAQEPAKQCYYLYGWDNKQKGALGINWDQATATCTTLNKQLAIIANPQIQSLIVDMVSEIHSDIDQVWISGKRDYKRTLFQYIDGSSFTGTVRTFFYNNHCVKRYMDKHGLVEYQEIRCTDDLNVFALCQHHTPESACTGFYHNELCYSLSNTTLNWFDAMSFCYRETQGSGTLAFVGLDQPSIVGWLNGIRGDKYSLEVVVGIRRQPWMWISDVGEEPISLFYWARNAGYYDGNRCVTVIPKQNGLWKEAPCNELWYYYICQNGTTPTTTTTTTTTTTPIPPTTPQTTLAPGRSTLKPGSGTTPSDPQDISGSQSGSGSHNNDGSGSGSQNNGDSGSGSQSDNSGSETDLDPGSSTGDETEGVFGTKHIVAIVCGILAIGIIVGVVFAIQRCRRNPCTKGKDVESEKVKAEEIYIPANAAIKQNGVIRQNGDVNGDVKHVIFSDGKSSRDANGSANQKTNGSLGRHSNGNITQDTSLNAPDPSSDPTYLEYDENNIISVAL